MGKSGSTLWKAPESWFVEIEQFAPEGPDNVVVARRRIGVMISGKDKVGNIDCWGVTFVPPAEAGLNLGDYYSLSVAKETGWPLKVVYLRSFRRVPEPILTASVIGFGHPFNSLGMIGASPSLKAGLIRPTEQTTWLQRFGKASFITAAPEGNPVEIFPLYQPGRYAAPSGAELTLRSVKEAEYHVVEAVVKINNEEKLLIRQKWIEGEKWWREYERRVDGRKDLAARQVMPPPAAATVPADPSKPDPLALSRDRKLHAVIEVEEKGAKVADLFERIQKATGLLLTVDADLAHHQPNLGSIQPSQNGWRAYQVMGIIARVQMENGQWVKTAKGYKLTGVSRVPPPEKLAEDGVPPAQVAPPPRSYWGWLGGGAGLLVVASAGYGIFRWRRKRSPTPPPAPAAKTPSKKPKAQRPSGGKQATPS